MKSKNYIYVSIIVVFAIVTLIFFTSRAWLPDDRALANKDYNEPRSVGTYTFKLSDAVIDKKTNALTANLYLMSVNP